MLKDYHITKEEATPRPELLQKLDAKIVELDRSLPRANGQARANLKESKHFLQSVYYHLTKGSNGKEDSTE